MKMYTLTGRGYDYLIMKLGKINKRAVKLGLGSVETDNVRRYMTVLKAETPGGVDTLETWVDFYVTGERPSVSGYKVIAKLENIEGKNVVRYMLGESGAGHDIEVYRERVNCDHCNVNRLRKHTYILLEEGTGFHKQVGSTCMQDFLEGDLSYILEYAKLDIENICEEAVARGIAETEYIGLEQYLCMAIRYVNEEGYVRTGEHRSTGQLVWENFYGDYQGKRNYNVEGIVVENREEAIAIIAWAKGLRDTRNEYLWNLSVIAGSGCVTDSLKGYAASMVTAYRRELVKAKLEKESVLKEGVETESEHVGVEGERIVTELTLQKIVTFATRYGDTDMLIYKDNNGNDLKWVTTSRHEMKEGETYSVQGTVKGHGEYRGGKQTTLVRVSKVKE